MQNNFFKIENFSDIEPHITDDFCVYDKGSYKTVNYYYLKDKAMFEGIRQEFRGIKFCGKTGKILARPLHKFFNLHELNPSEKLRLSEPFEVYEKFDGSMVHTILVNGELYLHTKNGDTDIGKHATDYLKKFPKLFSRLKEESKTKTFIFEYVAPSNQIVVAYDIPSIVPIAVRDTVEGTYLAIEDWLYEASEYSNDKRTVNIDKIFQKKDIEGFVFVWPDGFRVKAKTDWYVRVSKIITNLCSPKNVILAVLNKEVDDICQFLPETAKLEFLDFSIKFGMYCDKLMEQVNKLISNYSSKEDFFRDSRNTSDVIDTAKFLSGYVAWCYSNKDATLDERQEKFNHVLTNHFVNNKRAISFLNKACFEYEPLQDGLSKDFLKKKLTDKIRFTTLRKIPSSEIKRMV